MPVKNQKVGRYDEFSLEINIEKIEVAGLVDPARTIYMVAAWRFRVKAMGAFNEQTIDKSANVNIYKKSI